MRNDKSIHITMFFSSTKLCQTSFLDNESLGFKGQIFLAAFKKIVSFQKSSIRGTIYPKKFEKLMSK